MSDCFFWKWADVRSFVGFGLILISARTAEHLRGTPEFADRLTRDGARDGTEMGARAAARARARARV